MNRPKFTSHSILATYLCPVPFSFIYISILFFSICFESSASDIKRYRLNINDVAYWQSEEKFILSIFDSDTTGKIIFLDSYNGEITRTIQLDHNPGSIEISHDSKYIFVGFLDVKIVSKYSIENFEEVYKIDLDWSDTKSISDIKVIPGYEDRVIINTERESYDVKNGLIINELPLRNIRVQSNETLYGILPHNSSALGKVLMTADTSYIDSTYNNLLVQTGSLSIKDSILYNSHGDVISLKDNHPRLIGRVSDQVLDESSFAIAGLSNSTSFLWASASKNGLTVRKINEENFSLYSKNTFDMPGIRVIFKVIPWSTDNIAVLHTNGSTDKFFSIIRRCEPAISEEPLLKGPDKAGCIGDSVTVYAEPDKGKIFWSNGYQGDSIKFRYTDEIYYQIADGQGCLSPKSKIYTLKQTQRTSYSSTVDTVVSCENQPAKITTTLIPNKNFVWSDGQTAEQAKFSQTGNYILFDVSETGCHSPFHEYYVKILPNARPSPPELIPDSTSFNCAITFKVKDYDSSSTYQMKELTNNTISPYFMADYHGNGYYQVRRTDQQGCISDFSAAFNFQHFLYGYSVKNPEITNINGRLVSDDVYGTQWYRNEETITEIGPPVLLPEESGFYNATNHYYKKCSTNLSNTIFIPSLKANQKEHNQDISFRDVHIFPNPFRNYLKIRPEKEKVIVIHTSDGKLIYRNKIDKEKQIETQRWKPGVYIISILEDGNYIENFNVVKS